MLMVKEDSIHPILEHLSSVINIKFEYYRKMFLERKISYRMKNLNLSTYQSYLEFLKANPEEIDKFKEKFTVVYTYFFRNFEIYEKLKEIFGVPNKNLKKVIRIWSCPCASGEEPYSIAMLFDYIQKNNKNFPAFEIIASDIDKKAISVAIEGVYGEYAVHEIPNIYLTTYFTKQETNLGLKFVVSNHIKEKVEFIEEDVINGHTKNYKYDIIFCRNFFIYLKRKAQEKLLKVLESKLVDGGLLVLGLTETILHKNTNLKLLDPKIRIYVKNGIIRNGSFKKDTPDQLGKQYSQIKEQSPKKDEFQTQTKKAEQNSLPMTKKFQESIVKIEKNKSEIETPEISIIQHSPSSLDQNPQREYESKQVSNPNMSEQKFPINTSENLIVNTESINIIKHNEKIQDLTDPRKIIPIREEGLKETRGKNDDAVPPNTIEERLKQLEQKELQLKQWEMLLGKKQKDLEQLEVWLEQQEIILEQKQNKTKRKVKYLNYLTDQAKQQEIDYKIRIKELDQIKKQIEERKKRVELREQQLDQRINQLGLQMKQIVLQEKLSKDLTESHIAAEISSEESGLDRILNPNPKGELIIPVGYYGLINKYDNSEKATKFSIHGLGSGIALILKDTINKLFAISHISFPDSTKSKTDYHLLFPHTFIDTSVKNLINKLMYNGAEKENITAMIVGGAKLFMDYDLTFQENIDAIKKELMTLQIKIEIEELGGISERSLIYDTTTNSLFIQKTWENEFRKIC